MSLILNTKVIDFARAKQVATSHTPTVSGRRGPRSQLGAPPSAVPNLLALEALDNGERRAWTERESV